MKTFLRRLFRRAPSYRELSAENDRLMHLLSSPSELQAHVTNVIERCRTDVTMKHWGVRLMVSSFADTIGDAPNCCWIEVGDDEFGRFEVTIKRKWAKSPETLLGEAKQHIAALLNVTDFCSCDPHDRDQFALAIGAARVFLELGNLKPQRRNDV